MVHAKALYTRDIYKRDMTVRNNIHVSHSHEREHLTTRIFVERIQLIQFTKYMRLISPQSGDYENASQHHHFPARLFGAQALDLVKSCSRQRISINCVR